MVYRKTEIHFHGLISKMAKQFNIHSCNPDEHGGALFTLIQVTRLLKDSAFVEPRKMFVGISRFRKYD